MLTVGAVLGVLCLLVVAASALFDVRPLVFESGSMSPTIQTGALAISHRVDAADLEAGDVVSVPTGAGERVTHRVVTVTVRGDVASLALKGDANESADPRVYEVGHADRVLFDVPMLGYALGWLTGGAGLFLLGLYAAFLLSVIVKRPAHRTPPRPSPSTPRGGRRRATGVRRARGRHQGRHSIALSVVLVCAVASGLVLAQRITPTLAAWNDNVGVTGMSMKAYTVPAPAYNQTTCTLGGTGTTRTIAYSWPATVAPLPALSYDIVVSGIAATSAVSTSGSTATVTVTFSTSTATNQNKPVKLTAVSWPTGASTWKSATTTTWRFRTRGSSQSAICGEIDPPSVTFTQPLNLANRTRAAQTTSSNSSCANTPACGSSSDGSATTMMFRFERTVSAAVTCWNTSWSAANCSTAWRSAGGTSPAWRLTGTAANAYTVAGSYMLRIQATDAYGNVTTQTINFTLT
ncbi:signal peptidase I [Nocardioides sp. cx-169]|nr:signal peptidase I [Nocardioides sp. cx-169]